MGDAARGAIRVSAFVRKESVEILRQPRLVLSLVLGPFLILLLFGAGLRDVDPLVHTVLVAPADGPLRAQVEQFADTAAGRIVVEDVITDRQEALDRLRGGPIDLVVAFPDNASQTISSGQQAEIEFLHDYVDPIETRAVELASQAAVAEINQLTARAIVERGQESVQEVLATLGEARSTARRLTAAVDEGDPVEARRQAAALEEDVASLGPQLRAAVGVLAGLAPAAAASADVLPALEGLPAQVDALTRGSISLDEARAIVADLEQLTAGLEAFGRLTPQVVVSPFTGSTQRAAAGPVDLTDFYAPAVVVLLTQHMVISFIGLSVVREEQLGTSELFRVAPLRTGELLLGKYLAYLLLGAAVTAIVTALLVLGLGVPMRGAWSDLVITMAGLLTASIGLGFLLALLAQSDSQAIQFAMLVLLATIFFSGFILTLERFAPALRLVSWLLPATYGIELLRSVMLRGTGMGLTLLAGLTAMIAVLWAGTWLLLRRRMGPA